MARVSLDIDDVDYRAIEDCGESSDYPENPEELLAEDCGMDCDLCMCYGEGLISKTVRESALLSKHLSNKLTEPHPIDHDDLCSWVSCCNGMEECQACDFSPQYIAEWLEEVEIAIKKKPNKAK